MASTLAVSARPSARVWSAVAWRAYFRRNDSRLLSIPWERGVEWTDEQRVALAASLREFQQGEGQEGGHFFRCVQAYGQRTGNHDYVAAHALFMAEERRHARDLARFLTLAGVPLLTERSWLSWLFCWFGSRGGLEMTLLVILMAEVIALVYYAAVRRATDSAVLRRLCTQILRDEKMHVRFHCQRLAQMRRQRSGWLLALDHTLDGLLLLGAGLACWCNHRLALRRGGYGWRAFWQAVHVQFVAVVREKDPRAYAWGDG